MENNRDIDLAIIGGGIIGLMTAFFARKKFPDWSIIVLDKAMLGQKTTAFSAYLDLPYGTTEYKRKLTDSSRKLFQEEIYPELEGIQRETKTIYGCSSEASLHKITPNITEACYPSEFSSIKMLWPEWVSNMSNQIILDGLKADYLLASPVSSLTDYLVKKEVAFYEGCSILSVEHLAEGFDIFPNVFPAFHAKRVVECTGPTMYKESLLKGSSPIDARIKKVVALHLNIAPKKSDSSIYFFDDDAFLIPHYSRKRWLFSYRCQDWDIAMTPKSLQLDHHNLKSASQVLEKYAPNMSRYLFGARVYCDLYTASGDPIIEELQENYVRIGALGGSGYRLSPALAQEVITKLKNTES